MTGRVVCVCTPLPGEQMTAFQLKNCVVTLLAEVLPAPRISIRLFWVPSVQAQFDVEFMLGLLTSWIDDLSLYDEMYDPHSLYWEDHGPLHKPGMMGCLYCGDSTQDVDDTDVDRSELCLRCNPCAVCPQCRCTIRDEPVCMACLKDPEECGLLTDKQLRWYSFFAQDMMPFEQIVQLGLQERGFGLLRRPVHQDHSRVRDASQDALGRQFEVDATVWKAMSTSKAKRGNKLKNKAIVVGPTQAAVCTQPNYHARSTGL